MPGDQRIAQASSEFATLSASVPMCRIRRAAAVTGANWNVRQEPNSVYSAEPVVRLFGFLLSLGRSNWTTWSAMSVAMPSLVALGTSSLSLLAMVHFPNKSGCRE